jgi:hypothetical protein
MNRVGTVCAGLVWVGLALGPWPAAAETAGAWIEATVNTQTVRLGESFRFVVTAGARNAEVRLPGPNAVLPDCRQLAYHEQDVSQRHEGFTARQGVYTLAAFGLDRIELPPLEVRFTSPEGTTTAASTPPLTLRVLSARPGAEFELRDPRPPVVIRPWGAYLLAALAVGLGAGAWFLTRRRRSRASLLPAPHLEAWQSIDAVGKSRLVAEGRVDLYFTELSRILRRYCSRCFDLPAMELSRREVYRVLRRQGIALKACRLLNSLLIRSDLVKFAKEQVDFPQIARAQQRARDFIQLTRPVSDPAPAGRGRRRRV